MYDVAYSAQVGRQDAHKFEMLFDLLRMRGFCSLMYLGWHKPLSHCMVIIPAARLLVAAHAVLPG